LQAVFQYITNLQPWHVVDYEWLMACLEAGVSDASPACNPSKISSYQHWPDLASGKRYNHHSAAALVQYEAQCAAAAVLSDKQIAAELLLVAHNFQLANHNQEAWMGQQRGAGKEQQVKGAQFSRHQSVYMQQQINMPSTNHFNHQPGERGAHQFQQHTQHARICTHLERAQYDEDQDHAWYAEDGSCTSSEDGNGSSSAAAAQAQETAEPADRFNTDSMANTNSRSSCIMLSFQQHVSATNPEQSLSLAGWGQHSTNPHHAGEGSDNAAAVAGTRTSSVISAEVTCTHDQCSRQFSEATCGDVPCKKLTSQTTIAGGAPTIKAALATSIDKTSESMQPFEFQPCITMHHSASAATVDCMTTAAADEEFHGFPILCCLESPQATQKRKRQDVKDLAHSSQEE
jgi:hypothetical protein